MAWLFASPGHHQPYYTDYMNRYLKWVRIWTLCEKYDRTCKCILVFLRNNSTCYGFKCCYLILSFQISTSANLPMVAVNTSASTRTARITASVMMASNWMRMVKRARVSLNFLRLTHWDRVTHICVGELTMIGSDDSMSPARRQAIIWTNAGLLLIRPMGTNFGETLIKIYIFSFKKMHSKMSSGNWRPFCLGLNVLSHCGHCYLTRKRISVHTLETKQYEPFCDWNIARELCYHHGCWSPGSRLDIKSF